MLSLEVIKITSANYANERKAAYHYVCAHACVFLGLIDFNLSPEGCSSMLSEPKEREFTEGTGEETPTIKNKVFLHINIKRRVWPAKKEVKSHRNKCGSEKDVLR